MNASPASSRRIRRALIGCEFYHTRVTHSSMMTRSLAPRPALRSLRFALIGALAYGLACGEGNGRPASLEEWQAQRSRLDETVWANERLAQHYERSLVALWDALLAADRRGDAAAKADVLANDALERITLGRPVSVEALDHGIERFASAEPLRRLDSSVWSAFVREPAAGGYQLVQSEWHHARFEPPQTGAPTCS